MLDLSALERPTLDIKLPDETIVKLYPAKKKLIDRMIHVKEAEDTVSELYSITAELLSYNTEGRAFALDDVSEWDIGIVAALFGAYTKFIAAVQKRPN